MYSATGDYIVKKSQIIEGYENSSNKDQDALSNLNKLCFKNPKNDNDKLCIDYNQLKNIYEMNNSFVDHKKKFFVKKSTNVIKSSKPQQIMNVNRSNSTQIHANSSVNIDDIKNKNTTDRLYNYCVPKSKESCIEATAKGWALADTCKNNDDWCNDPENKWCKGSMTIENQENPCDGSMDIEEAKREVERRINEQNKQKREKQEIICKNNPNLKECIKKDPRKTNISENVCLKFQTIEHNGCGAGFCYPGCHVKVNNKCPIISYEDNPNWFKEYEQKITRENPNLCIKKGPINNSTKDAIAEPFPAKESKAYVELMGSCSNVYDSDKENWLPQVFKRNKTIKETIRWCDNQCKKDTDIGNCLGNNKHDPCKCLKEIYEKDSDKFKCHFRDQGTLSEQYIKHCENY